MAATGVRTAQVEVTAEPAPTPRPRKPKLLPGIDVSHHNGNIDYQAVKDAGHRFVFIKATQDNDFVDPMFTINLARARGAGLAAGAYHFFDYTLDGKAQANHFLDRVEAAGGVDDALPPVVDVECWGPIGASIHAVSATRLRDFVERVYERSGRMPIVYTSVHMWREVMGNAEGFEDLPLWAACWGCDEPPSIAPGWEDWTFWQTGISRIPDVGRLDGNYFGGTRKQLNALKLRPFAIEGGDVATAGGEVELDLGGRDATHIRTSPDGESWSKWGRIRSAANATVPAEEGEHTVFAQLRNGPGLKSPVVSDSIIVDRTAPNMSPPVVSLRTGPLGADGSIPIAVAWDVTDEVAGLSDATVAVRCDEGRARRTEAPGSAAPAERVAWLASVEMAADATCDVTAISRDGAGNTARETAVGLRILLTSAADSRVEDGQVGVIAGRGPEAGRAAVLLDGEAVGLVDLYAPEASDPEVVYVTEPGTSGTVSVEATGSSDPESLGTSIVIESFATLTNLP